MSLIWKVVYTVYVPTLQYLPGRRRNTNAIQVGWGTFFWKLVPPWATLPKVWRMDIGRVWNLESRWYSL